LAVAFFFIIILNGRWLRGENAYDNMIIRSIYIRIIRLSRLSMRIMRLLFTHVWFLLFLNVIIIHYNDVFCFEIVILVFNKYKKKKKKERRRRRRRMSIIYSWTLLFISHFTTKIYAICHLHFATCTNTVHVAKC
jgi:dolichol kinase